MRVWGTEMFAVAVEQSVGLSALTYSYRLRIVFTGKLNNFESSSFPLNGL